MEACKHENRSWKGEVMYSSPLLQDCICRDCLASIRAEVNKGHPGDDDHAELLERQLYAGQSMTYIFPILERLPEEERDHIKVASPEDVERVRREHPELFNDEQSTEED